MLFFIFIFPYHYLSFFFCMVCVCGLKLTHYLKKMEYLVLFFDCNIAIHRTLFKKIKKIIDYNITVRKTLF